MAINYNLGGDYSNLSGLQLTGTLDSWAQGYATGDLGGIGAYTAQQTAVNTSASDLQKQADDAAMARQKDQQAYETEVRQRAAIDAVQAAFAMYGLSSLFPKVEEYAKQGLNADAIVLMLRQTQEYKQRFPAMEALNAKGKAMTEAEYIDYEKAAGQIEQRYGLPKGMLMGQVTRLLTNEVSIAELNDRVTLASADSLQAPQDLRDTLRDYYNLDPDTALAAYYLDPEIALPLLEKQSAAARIGVWASRQGVGGVGVGLAEYLQGLGVTEDRAQQGFGNVKAQEGLMYGKGDVASLTGLVDVNVAGKEDASVERTARSRVGRFSGGGQYAQSKSGVSGLGGAAQ